jgi:hypothetical protein
MNNDDGVYSIMKSMGMSDAGALQKSIMNTESEQLEKMGGYSKYRGASSLTSGS